MSNKSMYRELNVNELQKIELIKRIEKMEMPVWKNVSIIISFITAVATLCLVFPAMIELKINQKQMDDDLSHLIKEVVDSPQFNKYVTDIFYNESLKLFDDRSVILNKNQIKSKADISQFIRDDSVELLSFIMLRTGFSEDSASVFLSNLNEFISNFEKDYSKRWEVKSLNNNEVDALQFVENYFLHNNSQVTIYTASDSRIEMDALKYFYRRVHQINRIYEYNMFFDHGYFGINKLEQMDGKNLLVDITLWLYSKVRDETEIIFEDGTQLRLFIQASQQNKTLNFKIIKLELGVNSIHLN